jgi:hypothetical protein
MSALLFGGLPVGKKNLHVAGLVGAAMCSASHDDLSVKAKLTVIRGGLSHAGHEDVDVYGAQNTVRAWKIIGS